MNRNTGDILLISGLVVFGVLFFGGMFNKEIKEEGTKIYDKTFNGMGGGSKTKCHKRHHKKSHKKH